MNKSAVRTVRDKAAMNRLLDAFEEFCRHGKSTASCEVCGTTLQFHKLSNEAWQSSCSCGKYNDTLRGL